MGVEDNRMTPFATPRRLQIIRTIRDLEEALEKELIPISRTPPYFAERGNKDKAVIVMGDGDTFTYDSAADGDNTWVGAGNGVTQAAKHNFNTAERLHARVLTELMELEEQFQKAGFNHVDYLPSGAGLMNWIYINNAMAAGFNAEGKPYLYFGSMRNDNRKPEPVLVEHTLRGFGERRFNRVSCEISHLEGLIIGHASGKYPMEGKGDQLPMSLPVMEHGKQKDDTFYHAVINCSGRRTAPEAIREYAAQSGNYVIEIPLPESSGSNHVAAYHGNVALFYFQKKEGTRGVCYIPDMLREDARDFAYSMFSMFFGEENVHRITQEMKEVYKEGTENLSMNVIALGEGRIVSSENHPATNLFLEKELELEVLPVNMRAISLGGGGLQCTYSAFQYADLEITRPAEYVGLPEFE